ncbi:MAG: hypothetical protein ACUVQG_12410 [Thermogutta sp.]
MFCLARWSELRHVPAHSVRITVLIIVVSFPAGFLCGEVPQETGGLPVSSVSERVNDGMPPVSGIEPSVSQAASTDLLRKQNLQQQVRQMAKRLVADRLTEQILQLEENGLTHLPLYAELREMQGHLDELVETHMKEVLVALEQLIQAPPEKQPALFQFAREKSRNVLVRLLIEREKILRRLRIAEIEERVVRLIERETGVLEKTRKVPIENSFQQVASAVAIREDQQDVYTLFRGLKEALSQIETWGGRVGTEATAALAALAETQVDDLFVQSLQRLSEGQLIEAARLEGEIIAALQALLERIRRFQGELESDSKDAVRRAIEEMAKRQEDLRRQTLSAENNPQQLEPLTESQLQLQKEIEQAVQKLSQSPQPLHQAAQAAAQATDTLFQGDIPQAAEHQQSVVDHLREAAESLENEATGVHTAEGMPDAQTLTAELADLRQVKTELEKIRRQQDQISQIAEHGQWKEAAEAESELGDKIDQVANEKPLPNKVSEAIEQAAETVKQSAQVLAKADQRRTESGKETGHQDSPIQGQQAGAWQTANSEQNQAPRPDNPNPQDHRLQKTESLPENQTLDSNEVRMATRRAEQTIDEAISAVEMALADAERARLAAELVEALQAPRQEGSPRSDHNASLAQQKASELQQLTAQQLAQVQSAKKAVESELPLTRSPREEALKQLGDLASQVVEAAASQQEAMGHEDRAREIRSADDMKAALERARQAGELSQTETANSPKNQNATAQEKVTAAANKALASLEELSNLLQSETPEGHAAAMAALQSAKQASEQASKHLATEAETAKDEAFARQKEAAFGLAKAAEQIQSLANALAPQVASEFAERSQTAQQLANTAIPVHPEATSNLHAAENSAQRVADRAPASPEMASEGERGFEHGLTAAVAALAEREDQLSRALAAAQKIPELLEALEKQPELLANQSSAEDVGEATTDSVEMALAAVRAAAQQVSSPQSNPSSATQSPESSSAAASNQMASRPSDVASAESQGGVARGGNSSQNRTTSERPLQAQTGRVNADSRGPNQQGQSVAGESEENIAAPWLLELPERMREAIRSGMALPPPKGYEDRLRRYFQNLE